MSKLERLRSLMVERKVDVYIVPSEDSHASEYIAPCDARRAFISGFTGSAGWAVVTLSKAALATDGRYFNQASRQLDDKWILLKQGLPDVLTWQDWTAEQSTGGKTVAVDPCLIPGATASELDEKVKKSGGAGLVALHENLVDVIWGNDRPARPSNPITVHPVCFAGRDVGTKLGLVREKLAKHESPGLVLSMLDEVAWLLNLRGGDIPFNPVFFSYVIVTKDSATLYTDTSKLDQNCETHLTNNNVAIKGYDDVYGDAAILAKAYVRNTNGIRAKQCSFLLPSTASWALKLALEGDYTVDRVRSPVAEMKAVKNDTELAGMRGCHDRDGAAFIQFFAWLEDQLCAKKAVIDEFSATLKLESFRAMQKHYVGLSFPTISAAGPNAAVVHYVPEQGSCSAIESTLIYLCDSGAQYLDGTTDTTRTLHFGTPTDDEKRAYTLVLKGNIALDTAVFTATTTGFALDILARQFLRRDGFDYRHSTGHGVGSYLNVHELPVGISSRPEFADVCLAPGNVVTNEPGYYEDGCFGIRIENVAIVTRVKTRRNFEGDTWLGFEHVTMVPYCRSLIDTTLLTAEEKQWLNDYHDLIYKTMQGRFKDDALTLSWLVRETQPF